MSPGQKQLQAWAILLGEAGGKVTVADPTADQEIRLSFEFPRGSNPVIMAELMHGYFNAASELYQELGGSGLAPTPASWADWLTLTYPSNIEDIDDAGLSEPDEGTS